MAAIVLLVATTGLLALGAVAYWAGWQGAAVAWGVGGALALAPALWWAWEDLRAGRLGADVLAVLALVGTLAVGEHLAAALIGVMLATGRALDTMAQRRAHRDLSALLDRAPRQANLLRDGHVTTVRADEVRPGDLLVVRPGEIVPVDGRLTGDASLDESALTGEATVVERGRGEPVRSGVLAVGTPLELEAIRSARDSTYAGVVRLVEQATAASAPVVRLADRIAAVFLPVAVVIAGLAWLLTGDAVRAVAVLVTATPCPLLLAVPVAVTAGLSRAARRGVVVRDGAALELLGQAATVVLDKTGTVTTGRPSVIDVVPAPGQTVERVLGSAAAVEQLSGHPLARAVVEAGRAMDLRPQPATGVSERAGHGAAGWVGARRVAVGRIELPEHERPGWVDRAITKSRVAAASLIWVSEDDRPLGAVLARDDVRPDAARTIRRLRGAGLRRVIMLTGDRLENAQDVAEVLHLDEIQAGCTPEDKVRRVGQEQDRATTVMVGDGLNDAPALAAAGVGVALGGRGSAASAQAADAVLTTDRLDGLADVVELARRSRRIALQSAVTGVVLSLTAMGFAAVGLLPPAVGALLQEGIDLAVIANALRVLVPARSQRRRPREVDRLLLRFAAEHPGLAEVRLAVRHAADMARTGRTPAAEVAARHAHRLLVERLLPHENAEENQLYPVLGALLGGPESTATMSRGHAEIQRLVRRIGRLLDEPGDPGGELCAALYGLDAVLTLHFAQEEEGYFALAASEGATEHKVLDRGHLRSW
ncbi:heavy metal translocating P-type ATPase [Allokutzneria albata]|uniref:ATPase, P-type (Transporting), HAD superfamily, subfamily IC/heavy metal translocating P-type ATPase n=1 Tax=Allokutzneria albata TaxID=211114 RepID=A0A1G9SJ67_ALLAB|nr:heavy metal translocating P-type ATPase [Allokutzneria albata]SDM35536.1 ATPase, P-type (transporting), HAD superfamily, subfamily IC/heavy metal translocating P-type ATPase [Allokutzneria albata]